MPLPINVSLASVYVANEDGEVKTLLDDASDKLAEVVNAVVASGKSGALTIKIDLKPSTAGALAVRGDVKTKKPASLPREGAAMGNTGRLADVRRPKPNKVRVQNSHRAENRTQIRRSLT
jgi:hypothetical protein